MNWIALHWDLIAYVLGGLLGISEGLPFIKGTQAQGIIHGLAGLLSKKPIAPTAPDASQR
jgi:hypothetical protein